MSESWVAWLRTLVGLAIFGTLVPVMPRILILLRGSVLFEHPLVAVFVGGIVFAFVFAVWEQVENRHKP